MQKLLFQIFLIVCFMVYLKKYVNEHEKIYGIANIVFLSTAKTRIFLIELDQVQHELIIFLWKTRPYNFIVRPYIQLLIYSWSNIQLYIHTSSIYLCDRIQLDKTTWFSMTPKA